MLKIQKVDPDPNFKKILDPGPDLASRKKLVPDPT